jgi:hypothetical protein
VRSQKANLYVYIIAHRKAQSQAPFRAKNRLITLFCAPFFQYQNIRRFFGFAVAVSRKII